MKINCDLSSIADQKSWLKSEKIVKKSIEDGEKFYSPMGYIDIYESLPGFEPHEDYTNNQKIKSKWQKQTGIG
ncbi:MAG: hypothetical protein WBA39_29180 [Rivularia sp. (in: cyanobacteria)]